MAGQIVPIRVSCLDGKTQFLPSFALIGYTSWCYMVSHVTTSGANSRRLATSYEKSAY